MPGVTQRKTFYWKMFQPFLLYTKLYLVQSHGDIYIYMGWGGSSTFFINTFVSIFCNKKTALCMYINGTGHFKFGM